MFEEMESPSHIVVIDESGKINKGEGKASDAIGTNGH